MPTLGLMFAGLVGVLARQQDFPFPEKFNQMQSGDPALEMVEGAMVVVGGIVLLTPGVLTDCFGFALMIPKFRRSIAKKFGKFFKSFTVS